MGFPMLVFDKNCLTKLFILFISLLYCKFHYISMGNVRINMDIFIGQSICLSTSWSQKILIIYLFYNQVGGMLFQCPSNCKIKIWIWLVIDFDTDWTLTNKHGWNWPICRCCAYIRTLVTTGGAQTTLNLHKIL